MKESLIVKEYRDIYKYFKKIVRIKAQGIPMINQEKKIKIDFSWIKKKLSSIIIRFFISILYLPQVTKNHSSWYR